MPRSQAADYVERDRALLAHISLYGIGLPAITSKVLFDSKQAGHVLKKLSEDKKLLVSRPRSLPGGLSMFHLSASGAREIDAPKERAEPLGPVALDAAIAVAYFCSLDGPRRYKLERKELEGILGDEASPPANIVHLISDESDEPIVYRVYLAQKSATQSVQKIKELLAKARATPALRPWVDSGQYRVAVLVPTSNALKAYVDALSREHLTLVLVGVGPTAVTLASELKRRKS